MLQYHGLNNWARDLLSATIELEEKGERICPDNRSDYFSRIVFVPVHRTTAVCGLDGTTDMNAYQLHRHEFPDGSIYEEYVQSVLLYSGPCYFIALTKEGEVVEESLWQPDAMKSATY